MAFLLSRMSVYKEGSKGTDFNSVGLVITNSDQKGWIVTQPNKLLQTVIQGMAILLSRVSDYKQ